MPLIIIIALLTLLKYLEVGFLNGLSWWWIIGLAAFAFLWFEFLERMLGLDKRKDQAYFEKMKKDRLKRSFEKKK
ncbi:MAG: TIGR04438 family Trp-rich protein [Undibacterium sp.]|jgi:small Trp-rich protein|uniref:TIGR04438 family Trp-rich protein n=1 Tax=Undibacterium sp. TaxID=1914977 RepID=UPI002724D67B|nr:TIGR04438 family Trp-rich protein [Undibacterium sp.]MDO8650896.1 TIGR04438 family Trp-rich protein [Undibacterium sp.]